MENEKNGVASCFVCKQEMMSDILAKKYCKLCGMILESSKEKFCCEDCEIKFNNINFIE